MTAPTRPRGRPAGYAASPPLTAPDGPAPGPADAASAANPPAGSSGGSPAEPAVSGRYDHLSRGDLVRLLERRDAARKLGLVWERSEIAAERALNDDFVALELDPALSEGRGPYPHLVIEGDNFDALRVLRATHAGRVKVFAFDPPYNTGAQDFVYNDRYVDKDDRFRHSVWLEFMYRRLTLAKELLRSDGVIFVNIGEDEHAHLSMLMDQVFPGMKVGTFVWRTRQGANDPSGAFFSQDHEYVLCYAGPDFAFGGHAKDFRLYKNPDGDPRGPWKSADITKAHTYLQRPNAFYPIRDPDTGVWYPCNPDSVWRFASRARVKPGQKLRAQPMEDLIADGRILFPKDDQVVVYETRAALDAAVAEGSAPFVLRPDLPDLDDLVGKPLGYGRPQGKRFLSDMKRTTKPLSSWIVATLADVAEKAAGAGEVERLVVGTNTEGTTAVQRILGGKAFTFPKPVSLLRALVGQATDPDEGHVVLDIFAGSGTTAQAVLELNAEDDGDRRFILVSSTEATRDNPAKNVCRDVTRERVARVMRGYQVRVKGKRAAAGAVPGPSGELALSDAGGDAAAAAGDDDGTGLPDGTAAGLARGAAQSAAQQSAVRGTGARVEGLGGAFAYLRAARLPMATVRTRLTHGHVWTALQLYHAGVVAAVPDRAPDRAPDEGPGGAASAPLLFVLPRAEGDVVYVPDVTDEAVAALAHHFAHRRAGVVYSWRPGVLRQRFEAPGVAFEKIPDVLVARFGGHRATHGGLAGGFVGDPAGDHLAAGTDGAGTDGAGTDGAGDADAPAAGGGAEGAGAA